MSDEAPYSDHTKETPVQTFYPGRLFDPFGLRVDLEPIRGTPSFGLPATASPIAGPDLEGTVIRMAVDPQQSFFGDALRAVDVIDEDVLIEGLPPFGWSGTELLGGCALTASQLSGEVVVAFDEVDDEFLPFQLNHGTGIHGRDSVLAAPSGYQLRSVDNLVVDANPLTHGVLHLPTGRVYDFHYNCLFWNTAIEALLEANPRLRPPPMLFPGLPHGGHALAWFVSSGSTLTITIAAQLFLPLGAERDGQPIRLPTADGDDKDSFLARHSSLHPFIFLHAEVPAAPTSITSMARDSVESSALEALQSKQVRMLCCPRESCFGDDFSLASPELGGPATGESPLFGTVGVQFGEELDGFMPFVLSFGPPHPAYAEKMAGVLGLLPPGSCAGLVGMYGQLEFPKVTYDQHHLGLITDPYKASVGIVDVATGEFASTAVLRKYLLQDLMLAVLATEPRTPSDSFAYLSSGEFSFTEEGCLQLELNGAVLIPYPDGYEFPLPDGGKCSIGPGSVLQPFLRLRTVSEAAINVDTLERITFVADEHVRGTHRDAFSLEVRPGGPGQARGQATLATSRQFYEGRIDAASKGRYGNANLYIGHVIMPADPLCIYYLTEQDGRADLQIVSMTERFDMWLRGSVAVEQLNR